MRGSLPILGIALAGLLAGCATAPAAAPLAGLSIPMRIQARLVAASGPRASVLADNQAWDLAQIHCANPLKAQSLAQLTVVAVLDTGVDPAQPQLAGRLYPMIDLVGADWDTAGGADANFTGEDGNGHGTHVAGIVAAVSVGFPVKILPIKVIACSGEGNDQLLSDGIDRAIAWRSPEGARVRVINLSLSSPESSGRLTQAIARANAAGILVVGASGNSGGAVEFPATLKSVLSVGATTIADQVADYSGHGQGLDMVAPGGSDEAPVFSTWPTYLTSDDLALGVSQPHQQAGLVGTSMAAPHVAGTAAVLFARHAGMSAAQVRSCLLSLADQVGPAGPDAYFGFGRLNFQSVFNGDAGDAY